MALLVQVGEGPSACVAWKMKTLLADCLGGVPQFYPAPASRVEEETIREPTNCRR